MSNMTQFDPMTGARVTTEQTEQPETVQPARPANGLYTAACALGAISIIINPFLILSILAIVLGLAGKERGNAGWVLGIIGTAVGIVSWVILASTLAQ